MPTVTENVVKAYAHCVAPLCPGYRQQEVDAVRVETAYGYKDNGGDMPGIERSIVELRWHDEDDRACPSCEANRELGLGVRPVYDRLSGFDPLGLLSVQQFDGGKVNTVADAKVAELEAKLAAQSAKLDRLLAAAEGE